MAKNYTTILVFSAQVNNIPFLFAICDPRSEANDCQFWGSNEYFSHNVAGNLFHVYSSHGFNNSLKSNLFAISRFSFIQRKLHIAT